MHTIANSSAAGRDSDGARRAPSSSRLHRPVNRLLARFHWLSMRQSRLDDNLLVQLAVKTSPTLTKSIGRWRKSGGAQLGQSLETAEFAARVDDALTLPWLW